MMRRELVTERRWLPEEEFLDLVGASSVIPGPTSTEVAMHAGRRRGGPAGLVVGGLAFILPAAVVMLVLAWAYDRYGAKPAATDIFQGVKPVVVAVVAQAVFGLGRTAVKTRALAVIGAGVVMAYLAGLSEPVILLLAAAVGAVAVSRPGPTSMPVLLPFLVGVAHGPPPTADSDLWRLFGVFFKVGALLFGSGYVLFAFLRSDLVLDHHWLTEAQLLDAIAIGQFTPGPLFTTATFVGYLLEGVPGAVVATVAIFLPAFLLVALLEPVIVRMRRSPAAGAALDGLNVAAVGVMAGVTWALGRDAVTDVPTALIAAAALVALVRLRVNPAWLILAGALIGLAFL